MLSIALAAFLALPSAQSSTVPDGQAMQPASEHPAVRLTKAWLEALAADDETFIRFMHDHAPELLGGPDQWRAFRYHFQGLRFYSLGSTTTNAAELWLFDPNIGEYVTAPVTLQPDDPDKIASIGIWRTDHLPAGAKPLPKLEGTALIDTVGARVEQEAKHDRFSGAVMISRRGRVLFQHAYGFADREARKPNTLDTQFRFGSMGKMFTAVAIMQLVEAGEIDVSAPIGHYLADYPNQDIAAKVTVANLLTHTGGTGDIFGPEFDAHKATLRDLKDYVDLYGERAPEFSPGARVAYSNYGFILLGRIVEAVSRLSYDDYIQRNIFDPAGMRSTGNLPESTDLPRRAVGYMGFGSNLRPADATLPIRGTSAGGGYSTVGDLNRFVDALMAHRLFGEDTLQRLITGGMKTEDGTFVRYDFGGTLPGTGRFIGHDGGAPGMNGSLMHFLDNGYTIVVLANRDPNAAGNLSTFTAHHLAPN